MEAIWNRVDFKGDQTHLPPLSDIKQIAEGRMGPTNGKVSSLYEFDNVIGPAGAFMVESYKWGNYKCYWTGLNEADHLTIFSLHRNVFKAGLREQIGQCSETKHAQKGRRLRFE